jgi:hypothetical protein
MLFLLKQLARQLKVEWRTYVSYLGRILKTTLSMSVERPKFSRPYSVKSASSITVTEPSKKYKKSKTTGQHLWSSEGEEKEHLKNCVSYRIVSYQYHNAKRDRDIFVAFKKFKKTEHKPVYTANIAPRYSMYVG